MKYYRKQKLFYRLTEEGFTASYQNFILKYERTGQLKCRRNPLSGHRIFSDQDIEGIVQALRKDGKEFKWQAK